MKQKQPPNYQRFLYSKFHSTGSNFQEIIYREFQDDAAHQRRVYGSFKTENDSAFLSGASDACGASSRLRELYSWIQTALESVTAALMIVVFVFSTSSVVGSSMEPTLREGDRVVIYSLFYTPRYGDVVALWAADLPNRENGGYGEMIVKRVIGLEGDVIDIDPVSGIVYRNGEALSEEYIMENINSENMGNAKYPLAVDEGCVFVLGDNRNRSTDSRYVDDGIADYYVGCVDTRYIEGRAVFRIFPFDRIGVIK